MKFLFKVAYETICLVYAKICTAFENYFIRRNLKSKSPLDKDGFLKITKKSKLNISKRRFDFVLKDNEKSFYSNKYQKKINDVKNDKIKKSSGLLQRLVLKLKKRVKHQRNFMLNTLRSLLWKGQKRTLNNEGIELWNQAQDVVIGGCGLLSS